MNGIATKRNSNVAAARAILVGRLDQKDFTRKLGNGKTPVANSEERLHSILATLEECRAGLIESASQEAARLLSVAILELRMKLNHIADSELKALCDAMLRGDAMWRDDAPPERQHDAKYPHGEHRRPLLKLVK